MEIGAIELDPRIREAVPGLALACVTAEVVVAESDDGLWARLLAAAERAAEAVPEPAAAPAIAALRGLYRALGKEPSRYRGSPEALVRRARAGKAMPRINNVVDAINVVSVETLLPIGLYDLAHVRPPVAFRRGAAGEAYEGIGKESLNLDGLPVMADAEGPFGSPTSDSRRTMITADARRILAVLFGVTGRDDAERAAALLAELLARHASATRVETSVSA
jgi:DNA/RNA-binding domain of Phe-tRNA-synthetase-like protein